MDVLLPRTPSISSREWGWACLGAVLIQAVFFTILTLAGASDTQVKKAEEAKPELIPIAVKPVLDDLPLLKLGSKQKVKQKLAGAKLDDGMISRQEAIIGSMTAAERRKPDLLNASRRRRIAAGSGTKVEDVNRVIKQYRDMATMMKKMRKMGTQGFARSGFPGFPPPR